MNIDEMLIEEARIPREINRRLAQKEFVTVAPEMVEKRAADGWAVHRKYKKSVRLVRDKRHDVQFEDRVWAVLARMGFNGMNRDRRFVIQYGRTEAESKQIDVFATDDDVAIVIECKSAEQVKRTTLKSEVEAYAHVKEGIRLKLRKEFPGKKVRFVLATRNYDLGSEARQSIADKGLLHLDERQIDYYFELADHLGRPARFQFLSRLFERTQIENLDTRVVATRGRMGGVTYYSFLIEPSRLLKIAYVLHRTTANDDLMPTYQRVIKKARLRSVANFVRNGGYFPNSIIISVDFGRRGPSFELMTPPGEGTFPTVGVLQLPPVYRAAYVIDGQHRLYGYADSDRVADDLIPVVAFANLDQREQLRLFMQINENQQAVQKNLRSTLKADIYWNSDSLRERSEALRIRVAEGLEDDPNSPLHNRIVLGANRATSERCITIDAIARGVARSNFVGVFTESEMKEAGTFYTGNHVTTLRNLTDFLKLAFWFARDELPEQWDSANSTGGFVFRNNGVEALIRLLSDLVDHLVRQGRVDPRKDSPDMVFAGVQPYLSAVTAFLASRSNEQGRKLRQMYGFGGSARYWRTLQLATRDAHSDFEPPDLSDYLEGQSRETNKEAFGIVAEIELHLKRDIRERLHSRYGDHWFHKGVPLKVQQDAAVLSLQKTQERSDGVVVDPWDCLHISDYRAILNQDHALWQELFSATYTRPGEESKQASWQKQTSWLVRFGKIRNDLDHEYTITVDDYDFICALRDWLVLDIG